MTISKKKLSLLALCSFVVGSNFSALRAEVMETTGEMGVREEPMVYETTETSEYKEPIEERGVKYGSKKVKTKKSTKSEKRGPVRKIVGAPFKVVEETGRVVTGRDRKGEKTTRKTKKTTKKEVKRKPKKTSMKNGGCPCPPRVQAGYDY